MLIDTHAHLNFSAFKDDFEEVIKRCLQNDIFVINVGTKYETSRRAVEIAQKHKTGIYAAVGLHPIHLEEHKVDESEEGIKSIFRTKGEEFDEQKYRDLARSKKVVAIGEVGLDYYWKPKTKKKFEAFKEKQREALLSQLNLAQELNLPVIFHCRMAHQDLIEVLKSDHSPFPMDWVAQPFNKGCGEILNPKLRGVIHCYTGNWQEAKRYLEMGLYLGFNGIIFKKIEGINFEEIIKNTPLDKILIETDCPYLTPLPAVASAEAGPQPVRNE
ncbi:TatD family hydrolase, partial [Patescibacteria group bacterium]|nr:TatD family hydrolase [Patescibacteria group bacterium]